MRSRLAGSLVLVALFVSAAASAQETPPPPSPPPPPVQPPPPVPPPPPPFMMPPPPPAHAAQRVTVTVDSGDKNAVLERRVKTDEMYGRSLFLIPHHSEVQTWEQVCVAPCKVDIDRAGLYRVGGENKVSQSGTFTLPPGTDPVKLDVDPGHFWWHKVGTRLVATGVAAAIVGGAFITLAPQWSDPDSEKDVRLAGIITGSIGLALLAAGIPMAILTQTHVKANDRKVAKAPPAPKLTLGGLAF